MPEKDRRGAALTLSIAHKPPVCSLGAEPDDAHRQQNHRKLQEHPPTHQGLRAVGAAAAHHVDEAKQEHDGDSGRAKGNKGADKRFHDAFYRPGRRAGKALRLNADPVRMLG